MRDTCTGSFVEVEVDQIVVGDNPLGYEIVQSVKTLHLNMLDMALGRNSLRDI